MPKISVIIPVYNAKDYLARCLDSVCNQTLKDIEIICVNDCSTDNSIDILNDYANQYPNMKVIDCKVNGGESVARNIGLDNATGEYIAFVDNDDTIDLNFYEKLYKKAKETGADIAKGEAHVYEVNGSENYDNLNEKIRKNNSKLFFSSFWWTGIYRRTLITDNNIRFIEGYPLGGDVLFLNEAILKCDKLELVDGVFYNYYRREDSGDSKILTFEKVKSVLSIHEKIVDNILNSPDFEKLDKNGIEYVFLWCFNANLTYCFRCKTINVLELSISKAFTIYSKISKYISHNNIFIYPVIMQYFINGTPDELKEFFIRNNTPQKVMLANLRFIHSTKSKE